MPIDVLVAHRRHAALAPTGVAYRAECPPLAFPDVDPPEGDEARDEALGWSRPVPAGATVRSIEPVGFAAPAPLESASSTRNIFWSAAARAGSSWIASRKPQPRSIWINCRRKRGVRV